MAVLLEGAQLGIQCHLVKNMNFFKNFKGQSILEIVILVGAIALIGTGLAALTLISLRNSQFSKNQIQATKLAQEAIDQVKTIKDRDYAVCSSANPATDKWSEIWVHCTSACNFTLQKGPATNLNCKSSGLNIADPFYLKSYNSTDAAIGTVFSRKIIITDLNNNEEKVEVSVSWSDSSGTHKSDLFTILTKHT